MKNIKVKNLTFITLLLLSNLAFADASHHHLHAKAEPSTESTDEGDLVEHGDYINSDGVDVHSPAHSKSGHIPQGARAKCRDGSYSFSRHHRGTCSGHKGVAGWL